MAMVEASGASLSQATGSAPNRRHRCAKSPLVGSMTMVLRTSADTAGMTKKGAMTRIRTPPWPRNGWSGSSASSTPPTMIRVVRTPGQDALAVTTRSWLSRPARPRSPPRRGRQVLNENHSVMVGGTGIQPGRRTTAGAIIRRAADLDCRIAMARDRSVQAGCGLRDGSGTGRAGRAGGCPPAGRGKLPADLAGDARELGNGGEPDADTGHRLDGRVVRVCRLDRAQAHRRERHGEAGGDRQRPGPEPVGPLAEARVGCQREADLVGLGRGRRTGHEGRGQCGVDPHAAPALLEQRRVLVEALVAWPTGPASVIMPTKKPSVSARGLLSNRAFHALSNQRAPDALAAA
jgi:hypothetical protein